MVSWMYGGFFQRRIAWNIMTLRRFVLALFALALLAGCATPLQYPAYVGAGRLTQNMSRQEILAADTWTYLLNTWRVRMQVRFTEGVTEPVKATR